MRDAFTRALKLKTPKCQSRDCFSYPLPPPPLSKMMSFITADIFQFPLKMARPIDQNFTHLKTRADDDKDCHFGQQTSKKVFSLVCIFIIV